VIYGKLKRLLRRIVAAYWSVDASITMALILFSIEDSFLTTSSRCFSQDDRVSPASDEN
jgi:uncharacterized protein YggT (Ycf19 family)